MKLILLFTVFCTSSLWSQSMMESELLKEKSKLQENLRNYHEYVRRDLDLLEKEKQRLAENKQKFEVLENYEKNFSSARAFTIAGLHAKIDSFSFTQKLGKT